MDELAWQSEQRYALYLPAVPVLLLMLITLLNDGTLISIGYDHVHPSNMPEKWNLKVRCGRPHCEAGPTWGEGEATIAERANHQPPRDRVLVVVIHPQSRQPS